MGIDIKGNLPSCIIDNEAPQEFSTYGACFVIAFALHRDPAIRTFNFNIL